MESIIAYGIGYSTSVASGYFGSKFLAIGVNRWRHLLNPKTVTDNMAEINNRILRIKLKENENIEHVKVYQIIQEKSDPLYVTPGKHFSIPVGGDLTYEKKWICGILRTNINNLRFSNCIDYFKYTSYHKRSYDIVEAKHKLKTKYNINLSKYSIKSPLIRIYKTKFEEGSTLYFLGNNTDSICTASHLSDDISYLARKASARSVFGGIFFLSGGLVMFGVLTASLLS